METTAAASAAPRRKNLMFLDIARIYGFVAVFSMHFLKQVLTIHHAPAFLEKVDFYLGTNLGLSGVAVSLFLIISGFGAMLSTERAFRPGKYYKGRFFRVLIPYYIAWLAAFLIDFWNSGNIGTLISDSPRYMIFSTLLAADGYHAVHGVPTLFRAYTGEWFLGILLFFYLLFPLFRICLKKCPRISFFGFTALYLLLLFLFPFDPEQSAIYIFWETKWYPFFIGCFIFTAKDRFRWKNTWPVFFAAVLTAVLILILKPYRLSKEIYMRSLCFEFEILAAALFLFLMLLEPFFQKASDTWKNRLVTVRNYSYEFFLVHHVVISRIFSHFASIGNKDTLILFFLTFTAAWFFAWLLKKSEDALLKFLFPKSFA